jgi:hypothetical protein
MADPISGTSIYLMPGMSVILESTLTNRNDFGWFVAKEIPPGQFSDMTNVSAEPINGFVVEDERVGTITAATDRPGAAVVYTHKRVESNAIWFFSVSGERGLVNVISVPIHDHSSVVHGGPAYGTYFDDEATRES